MKRYMKEEVIKDYYSAGRDRVDMVPNFPLIVRDGVIGVVTAITLAACWPFHVVPAGSRGIVTEFGKVARIENEGLAILAPWQGMRTCNIRALSSKVDGAEGSTSDTQPVKVSLMVRYNIDPDKVAHVYNNFSKDCDLDNYIDTAVMEVFKAVTAQYEAPELVTKRVEVSGKVDTALRNKLRLYGAQVVNIDMTNFAFSPKYMEAVNEKVTQEQLKLAAENKVKTVTAQQQEKVAIANAEASAAKAKADGEAYATLTKAKAEADSLRIQNEALRQNKDVLELRKIEVEMVKAGRWNGVVPVQNIFGTAPVPFFNTGAAK